MLETYYNTFGFFGAILVAFLSFTFFIFWIAGLAGIADMPDGHNRRTKLIVGVIFPPYPFFWMFYDIYRERTMMKEED